MKKRMKYAWLLALLAVGTLTAAVGCTQEKPKVDNAVYEVTLPTESVQLDLYGGTYQLSATTLKDMLKADGKVTWSSSAEDVVRVVDGRLEPLKAGEAVVTATWNGASAKCTVLVTSSGVPSLKTDYTSLQFIYGVTEGIEIDPWVVYKDVVYREEATFHYSIAEGGDSVASVDANGVVVPVGAGETELTVSASFRNYNGIGMMVRLPIKVFYDLEVNAMISAGNPTELYKKATSYNGKSYAAETTLDYSVYKMTETGMEKIDDAAVVWKSSDPSVLEVSADGKAVARDAGTANVYCEYEYNGIAHKSNAVELTVNRYLLAEIREGNKMLFDKLSPETVPTTAEIFGEAYKGALDGIYVNGKNVLVDNALDIAVLEDGEYEMEYVNGDGYAYRYDTVVASTTLVEGGVRFGLVKGQKEKGVQYYNVFLPTYQEVEGLLFDKGYRALAINCQYTADGAKTVRIASKYESEINETLTANTASSFLIDLNLFLDRYDGLNGFSKSEYLFSVAEGDGSFTLSALQFTNETSTLYTDFCLDRMTVITGPNGNFSVQKNVEKDGRVAQVYGKSTITKAGRVTVSSSEMATKKTMRNWLNDGYDVFEVSYYLGVDASKLTKPLTAYAVDGKHSKIGEDVALESNKWAVAQFSLSRVYAMRSVYNALFTFDAEPGKDGALEYSLYIESVKAKRSGETTENIRFYAGNSVDMWTPQLTECFPNAYYGAEVAGKTTNYYATFDVNGAYAWGCTIEFYIGLNVTREQLQGMKDSGKTALEFEIYAKTSVGHSIDLRLNPENKEVYEELHRYTLESGEWTTISIDLDLLISYYDNMNGCGNKTSFWKIMPFDFRKTADTVVYELAVGTIIAK